MVMLYVWGPIPGIQGTRGCRTTPPCFKDIETFEMYEHYFHFIHYFQKEISCSQDTQAHT